MSLDEELRKAKRLEVIAQRVGFALWQLQELEGSAAQYLILVTVAKPGVDPAVAQAAVEKAQSKTFGTTIKLLLKNSELAPTIIEQFQSLLAERNWLVHQSRATSRSAIHHDSACTKLIQRVVAIAEEAEVLMAEILVLVHAFVTERGANLEGLDEMVVKTLNEWHRDDAH